MQRAPPLRAASSAVIGSEEEETFSSQEPGPDSVRLMETLGMDVCIRLIEGGGVCVCKIISLYSSEL